MTSSTLGERWNLFGIQCSREGATRESRICISEEVRYRLEHIGKDTVIPIENQRALFVGRPQKRTIRVQCLQILCDRKN